MATSARTRRRLLDAALTDHTFVRSWWRGMEVWSGKCLHCGRRHHLSLDGAPLSEATVEHIVPRTHGGTDAPRNLAIACARCNHAKGRRQDALAPDDPAYLRVVGALQAERDRRWRPPEEAPTFTPRPR